MYSFLEQRSNSTKELVTTCITKQVMYITYYYQLIPVEWQ